MGGAYKDNQDVVPASREAHDQMAERTQTQHRGHTHARGKGVAKNGEGNLQREPGSLWFMRPTGTTERRFPHPRVNVSLQRSY